MNDIQIIHPRLSKWYEAIRALRRLHDGLHDELHDGLRLERVSLYDDVALAVALWKPVRRLQVISKRLVVKRHVVAPRRKARGKARRRKHEYMENMKIEYEK